jgi:DNA-binding MarR family transcriptional regulator
MSERVRSQIARDLLVDSSLSDADYMVLVHLSEAEDRRVRMTDLADRLNWSKSRLSHQLARMQARGLVEREECPSDARGAFAVLGAGGLAEIERAAPKHVVSVRRHLRNQGGCTGPTEDSSPAQPPDVLDSTSAECTLSGQPAGLDRAGWPAATDER